MLNEMNQNPINVVTIATKKPLVLESIPQLEEPNTKRMWLAILDI